MIRFLLIFIALLIGKKTFLQTIQCDCKKYTQRIFQKIDSNYIDQKKVKSEYFYKKIEDFLNKSESIKSEDSCLANLSDVQKMFNDYHIFVYGDVRQPEIIDSVNLKSLIKDYGKKQKNIEGIWYDHFSRIKYLIHPIIKNDGIYYKLVVLKSSNYKLMEGFVRSILYKNNFALFSNSNYQFFAMPYKVSKNQIEIGNNVILKRQTFINELHQNEYSYIDGDKYGVLKVPSPAINNNSFDSILKKCVNSISKNKILMIDLRYNYGGSVRNMNKILPLLSTKDIKSEDATYYATKGNIKIIKKYLEKTQILD